MTQTRATAPRFADEAAYLAYAVPVYRLNGMTEQEAIEVARMDWCFRDL